MKEKILVTVGLMLILLYELPAQEKLITNIQARKTTSLNGRWNYIVDQYETGFYDYRWKERNENDMGAYWNSGTPKNRSELKEHDYSAKLSVNVPGDWNSQDPKFLYYEGTLCINAVLTIKRKTLPIISTFILVR